MSVGELDDAHYWGTVTDPILVVLSKHQWVRVDNFRGLCLCGDKSSYDTTPHGYRLHVRAAILKALATS